MTWLTRDPERRSDPRRVLDGGRSVIVLAMNYFQQTKETAGARNSTVEANGSSSPTSVSGASPRGRIARYAWGDDYHEVIERKLEVLREHTIAESAHLASS